MRGWRDEGMSLWKEEGGGGGWIGGGEGGGKGGGYEFVQGERGLEFV